MGMASELGMLIRLSRICILGTKRRGFLQRADPDTVVDTVSVTYVDKLGDRRQLVNRS